MLVGVPRATATELDHGRSEFLVFGAPDIREPEIAEVLDALRSGWIGTGPRVGRFETAFAAYQEIPAGRSAALNSCTAALHVSMIAAGIGPGDEVITTPLTFCATANAILHAGATPVVVDVDHRTMNIDPEQIEPVIGARTRAILPVHFAGRPCEMDPIMEIARRHGLRVIEDCAHAIETRYRGAKAGTFGDFGCFSFYVTKNVVTAEGGMAIARDPADIGRLKILALHGMSADAWKRYGDEGFKHYDVVECGFKYNMTDLQAALGIHQLERVEAGWQRRQAIWQRYQEAFADLPITLPAPVPEDQRHAYHLYTILVDESRCGISRDAFLAAMTRRRIGTGVHYRRLTEHPFYQQSFGWSAATTPVATRVGRTTASLPLSTRLSDADVEDVVEAVRAVIPPPSRSVISLRPASGSA